MGELSQEEAEAFADAVGAKLLASGYEGSDVTDDERLTPLDEALIDVFLILAARGRAIRLAREQAAQRKQPVRSGIPDEAAP